MTNNTLKSTIESIRATGALIVVTAYGTFNSLTDASVLPQRVTVEARNKFLKDFCERATADETANALNAEKSKIELVHKQAFKALSEHKYAEASKLTRQAADIQAAIDEPRFYYKLKVNLDLRSVAEKRAEKKAQNEAKRAENAAEKAARTAEKEAAKPQPVAVTTEKKPIGKKAA